MPTTTTKKPATTAAKKKAPVKQGNKQTTPTPFGEVYGKLLSFNHVRGLRKGEIVAQYIKSKLGKREKFIWLGVVEKSQYNQILMDYTIFYRPFVSQTEKEIARMSQLNLKQMY